MRKTKVEVFCDDLDTLKAKMYTLIDLLPQNKNIKITIKESRILYPPEINYENCTASEILRRQVARLHENRNYHKRELLAEGEIGEAQFIKIIENAGFVVIRELNS